MLVVEGLTCRFGTKAAVDSASFSIAPGGFVGVIGRSGAGKSTLLRMINRLADPSHPCLPLYTPKGYTIKGKGSCPSLLRLGSGPGKVTSASRTGTSAWRWAGGSGPRSR